jgi:hypothetical protein
MQRLQHAATSCKRPATGGARRAWEASNDLRPRLAPPHRLRVYQGGDGGFVCLASAMSVTGS